MKITHIISKLSLPTRMNQLGIYLFAIGLLIATSNSVNLGYPGWEERTEWPADYPRPPQTAQHLFFIQRNLNSNTIVYDMDLKDGQIKKGHPIDAYWLRYQEDGSRKDLSWLQAVLAYGYTSKVMEEGYRIKLKAYNDRYLSLTKQGDNWKAFIELNGVNCVLKNIYVFADESGIFPDVKYVDIYGLHPQTGTEIKERIYNK